MKKNKFLKFLTLLLFFVVSNTVYSQDYKKLFDKGDRALNKKEFKKAEGYFTRAIEIRNTNEAHFKRGFARFKLKDDKGFCYDMEQATFLFNKIAPKMLDKYCYRIDTIENSSNHLVLERIRNNETPKETIIYSDNFLDTIIYTSVNDQIIYTQLKRKPQYCSNEHGMYLFFAKNVIYPRVAMIKGVQGTVIASCIIDSNGDVTNIDIITKRHPLLDSATKDVIGKIGKFTPARTKEGVAVPYKLIVPISFSLELSR